jgi:hypothetical protein
VLQQQRDHDAVVAASIPNTPLVSADAIATAAPTPSMVIAADELEVKIAKAKTKAAKCADPARKQQVMFLLRLCAFAVLIVSLADS